MTYSRFAEIIKEKRIQLGILQKDMADRIPTQKSRYNRIENGISEPTFIELQAIAKILDLDLTEILELKKPNHKEILFD